jgi:hypothetical protein
MWDARVDEEFPKLGTCASGHEESAVTAIGGDGVTVL